VPTHAIDVDKASIMPQNCYTGVPDCTKKVYEEGEEKIFLSSLRQDSIRKKYLSTKKSNL